VRLKADFKNHLINFEKKKNVVIVGLAGAAQRFRPVGNEEVRGRRGGNGE